MSTRFLLVEDDSSLGQSLKERLEKQGYEVDWSETLSSARDFKEKNNYDLVILDVGLPDGSGFDFAREIEDVPFIFLTALNNAEDRLTGYERGALEYIPKPFHLKELLIRVQRLLESHKKTSQLIISNFIINFDSMSIKTPEGKVKQPSAKDFNVLKHLIVNAPKVISRDELLNAVWGENNFPSSRTIDNTIVRLRQIFQDKDDQWIKSIRGVGYQWVK